jgi:hypothetical protein
MLTSSDYATPWNRSRVKRQPSRTAVNYPGLTPRIFFIVARRSVTVRRSSSVNGAAPPGLRCEKDLVAFSQVGEEQRGCRDRRYSACSRLSAASIGDEARLPGIERDRQLHHRRQIPGTAVLRQERRGAFEELERAQRSPRTPARGFVAA